MPLIVDLSSKNRVIDLDTPLPKGELVAERLTGTETLGRLFQYELMALSANGNIVFDDLLGHHVTAQIELTDGSRRPIDGRVSQISLVGMVENLFRYRLVLRPWAWMLTRTTDCRIFQDKNVKEILEEVFADQPDADFEFNLTADYAKRVYCVQYRETDFNFVSRLMEEEGIYYFFRHDPGKHTLVICDASGAHESVGSVPFMPQQQSARSGREYIREWSVTRQIQPCKVALRDYNFEKPTSDLLVKLSQDREHAEATHEIYDYPGEYQELPVGDHLIRTRLEELQSGFEIVEGRGDSRLLACGGTFDFSDFGRLDQIGEYLIVSTTIDVNNNALETSRGTSDFQYDVRFRLIRASEPYRSERTTPRPIVQGPQTAVIVGPSGEEIFVDKYGRVKVQFHWDRYGKKDDQSSCWVRVSQIWAGKNYGWMTIPRIGQEVVVDFLEGNPDEPLITGRVYNADQMPPWALPDNKTQSGILTRSTSGGSPETANQIRFEDKKGEEQVYVHAEKNMDTHVENDDSTFVGNDQTLTVTRDQKNTIKRDRWETVERDQHLTVNRDRITTIKNNEKRTIDVDQVIKISGKQSQHLVGNQDVQIDGHQKESVKGPVSQDTKASRTIKTDADDIRLIGGNQTFDVTGNMSYKAAKISLEAGHIDFKVTGGNSVIVESPVGPYQMMVNKLEIMSNTDVNILAVANINSVSMGNNTTVMGANSSAYVGSASDTMLAASRNMFIGMQSDAALAISMNNFIGLSLENALAAKVETAAGVHAELNSLKTYAPGGGGGGGAAGGPAALSGGWAAASFFGAGFAGAAGVMTMLFGAMEANQQYADAIGQLQSAAADADAAGHPNLANRLRALADASPVANGVGALAGGAGNAFTGFFGVPGVVSGPSVSGDDSGTGKAAPSGNGSGSGTT